MRRLGGVEEKVVRGTGREVEGEDEEEEINKEEIRKMLKELKGGKAPGMDGITNEVWKYGGVKLEEWIWKFCNRVWKGEG